MNNKGFTLVELLAVIVILSSISIATVVSVNNSLNNRDSKELEHQKDLAVSAAKIYFSLNNETCVNVSMLIDKYFPKDASVEKVKNGRVDYNRDTGIIVYSDNKCL